MENLKPAGCAEQPDEAQMQQQYSLIDIGALSLFEKAEKASVSNQKEPNNAICSDEKDLEIIELRAQLALEKLQRVNEMQNKEKTIKQLEKEAALYKAEVANTILKIFRKNPLRVPLKWLIKVDGENFIGYSTLNRTIL
jgi:hypothetical protein